MGEVDSRTQEDELLANAQLVDPDEAFVPATKLGIAQPLELWRRYSNRVLKTAYGITGKREDAEDAVQDAWMKPICI
jgi:RNA polymerase sigma-70 factor (ECF subfamily)